MKSGRKPKYSTAIVKKLYKKQKILMLSKYKNFDFKNKLKCEVCGYRWEAAFAILKRGSGCRKCYYNSLKLSEKFVKKSYKAKGIKLLSSFLGTGQTNKLQCLICDIIFYNNFANFKHQHNGCPDCAIDFKRLDFTQVKKDFKKKKIKISGEYKNNSSLLKAECSYAHTFYTSRSMFTEGKGCPICTGVDLKIGRSSRENECRKLMHKVFGVSFKKINHPDIRNNLTNRPLELDGFNKKLNIAFEYNGEQHYLRNLKKLRHYKQKDIEKIQYRDRIKKRRCKRLSIKLLVIPYWIKDVELYIREFKRRI